MLQRSLAILAIALIGTAAQAAPITFAFSGVVDNDPFGVFNDPLGSPATVDGTYTFDSNMPQVLFPPPSGGYADVAPNAQMSELFSATLDPTVAGPYVADRLNITVTNDLLGSTDQYFVTGESSTNSFLKLELTLTDLTGTAFSNTLLPLTPPSLAAFTIARFSLATFDGTQDIQAEGVLTALTCIAGCTTSVPEPSTPWLLAGALGVVALARRRASGRTRVRI